MAWRWRDLLWDFTYLCWNFPSDPEIHASSPSNVQAAFAAKSAAFLITLVTASGSEIKIFGLCLALEDNDGTNTEHENGIPTGIAIWVEDGLYVRLNSEPRSDLYLVVDFNRFLATEARPTPVLISKALLIAGVRVDETEADFILIPTRDETGVTTTKRGFEINGIAIIRLTEYLKEQVQPSAGV